MNCTRCRREIAGYSNYCYFCGEKQEVETARGGVRDERRLMRSSTDVKIAGVCAGFAEYFGWDPTVVRILWVVLTLTPIPVFPGVIGYFVAWLVMPVAPRLLAVPAPSAAVSGPGTGTVSV
jgi:phage shock protein C